MPERNTFGNTMLGMVPNAISAGMGLLLEGHNDRRQLRQQEQLQRIQMQGMQEMGKFNYDQQMKLWEATNYGPQVEQMKKAGLNPALMYKGAGAGGVTQALGAPGVGGGNAPVGGMEIMNMMMNKAQIELIKAQTEKTKAEAVNVPKTGANIDMDTELKKITMENQEIANDIAGATQNAQKAMVFQALRRSWEELEMTVEQNQWNQKQLEANFKQTTASIVEAYARATLNNAQTKLSYAQKDQVMAAIEQAWDQIDINATQAQTQQKLAEFTTGMGPQAASMVGDVLNFIGGIFRGRNNQKQKPK